MCGIFGVYPHKDAARLAYLGLYALQHRGEESSGIITRDGKRIHSHRWRDRSNFRHLDYYYAEPDQADIKTRQYVKEKGYTYYCH